MKHYGYDARPEGDLSEDILYQQRDAVYLSAVERGNMETARRMVDEAAETDIRYQDRGNNDLYFDDTVEGVVTRHFATHSAEIGEVLRNTADIDIAAGTVRAVSISPFSIIRC